MSNFDIVRNIRPPGELMKKDKLVEISGGQLVVANVSEGTRRMLAKNGIRVVHKQTNPVQPAHASKGPAER